MKYDDSISCVDRYLGVLVPRLASTGKVLSVEGVVETPKGIISVYSGPDHTRLDFICDGQRYRREWKPYGGIITNRSILHQAHKFMDELVGGVRR